MSDDTNSILTKEELEGQLNEIYASKLKFTEIKEKYGISLYAISDLKNMSQKEFERFLKSIPDIEGDLNKGKKPHTISADIACGTSIVSFVSKKICPNQNHIKSNIMKNYKKMETIWREYKLGESVGNLSIKYSIGDTYSTKELLEDFDTLINHSRLRCEKIKLEETKVKIRRRIKKEYGFTDNTIEYIVDGKEITQENQREEGR